MADTDTNLDPGGTPPSLPAPEPNEAEEREARGMGWSPKEKWRGDPESWVDAATFLKRGREMLPIVRAENGKLKGQLETTNAQLAALREQVANGEASMRALIDAQAEATAEAVKRAKANLRREIIEARKDGDVEAELAAQEQLDELVTRPAPAPAKAPAAAPATKQPDDPALRAWLSENTWYGQDKRRTGLAIGISEELRADPSNAGLHGKAFFDRLDEEMANAFGERRQSKVDGGRPGGGAPASAGRSNGHTFDDLPTEAQAKCKEQSSKLVGAGKAFKTDAEWRAHYARLYFSDEAN